MEVHAWVVTIPVGKWNSYGCRQLRKRFPRLIKRIDQDGYMDPEATQTGCYLAEMCREIVQRYDVDGIHLDYIRYPETWKFRIGKDQARGNITRIVEKIHQAVKKEKPWVKMSCSPIGKFDDLSRYWSHGWNAYTKVAQDAQAWLKDGLMDELFPMMYFRGDQFFPFAIDWKEHSYGKIIAPGLGIYFLDPSEGNWTLDEIERQMHFIRAHGLAGEAHYRVKYLMDNTQGLYDALEEDFYTAPALQPAMPWIDNVAPTPPSGLTVETPENGYWKLSWQPATDNDKRNAPMYVIYGSDTYPVDTSNPENILAQRVQGTEYTYAPIRPWTARKYFAVTAIDRCGNESEAIQQQ